MAGAVNSTQILVPSRAYVHVAPVGTPAPADETIALDPIWFNVGLTTPDSLSFSTEPEFEQVNTHQSDYPARRMQTSDSAAVSVDLIQWNKDNVTNAFGGGTVTQVKAATGTAGQAGYVPATYKFVPPVLGSRPEKSCIIEVIDGTKRYRWVFPRVQQVEGVSSELNKGSESRLPLRFAVLGDDTGAPFYLLTNDPAFV